MKQLCILVLLCFSGLSQAEVFKCTEPSGKIIYQASPCTGNEKSKELDIKADPKTDAEAKQKFDALQAERAVQIRLKNQANQDAARQTQQYQNQNLDEELRNAAAQHQQAIEQEKEAERIRLYNRLLF
ncbi:DUF4124 domain-containing protein [Methylomonas sp. AM2-LC]|uniref:DUF4124 domain-containing protein n=1 Tax=Methylomonas sp. AM2-LC TaxID=3153301 RepID=UPI003263464A